MIENSAVKDREDQDEVSCPVELLYKPVIVRKEVDSTHYYYVDGEFVPSVTKILEETLPTPYALKSWLGDVGNERAAEKLQYAGERGSAIHGALGSLLLGNGIKLAEQFPKREDQKCLVGFANWVVEYQPEVKNIEFTVASSSGYAGTLDLFCYIKGEPWIIDFKTSRAVYDSHKLQIVAYKNAFEEMTSIEARTGILHLNPKVKKGYTFHTDLEISKKPVSAEDFMAVYRLYLVLNGGKIPAPPVVEEYPEILTLKQDAKD